MIKEANSYFYEEVGKINDKISEFRKKQDQIKKSDDNKEREVTPEEQAFEDEKKRHFDEI